jgi:protein associated with RNAse G/E
LHLRREYLSSSCHNWRNLMLVVHQHLLRLGVRFLVRNSSERPFSVRSMNWCFSFEAAHQHRGRIEQDGLSHYIGIPAF